MRRALRGAPGVRVVVTGMGQAAAARAAADWVPRVRAVVVCGVAGGTGGAAGAGDVVVASGLCVAPGAGVPGVTPVDVSGAVSGLVASVEAVADTPQARAELRAAGVVAVETEAAAWAAACVSHAVPLAVVRGVLDTPEEPLGAAAGLVAAGGRGPAVTAMASMAARPRDWPGLLRLGRRAADVERRAAEAAVSVARSLAHAG